MIPLAFPVCINDALGSSRGPSWPVLSVTVQHGRARIPRVQCSISIPGRRPISTGSPGSSRVVWSGMTKQFRGLVWSTWSSYLENHKALTEKSLQTLQRVGTLIRSTSNNCIAALNTTSSKKAAAKPPSPGQSPGDDDGEDAAVEQLKTSLSRFITTASKAEVSQAALLSDLSNMAYDVEAISQQQLQQQHRLTMVAHSRAGQLPAAAGAAVPAATEQEALPEPTALLLSASSEQPQQVLYRPAESAGHSPAAPAWDAAPTFTPMHMLNVGRNGGSNAGLASPPTSPRTPFVLSSFSEAEDLLATADVPQMATAAAAVSSPSTPRRLTSAQSAGGSSRAAPAAAASALDMPMMLRGSGGSAGAALASQLMHYQQEDMEETAACLQQQHQHSASLTEQQALLELQQQEQQVLAEMQQHQQLQLLLQQEQAIMQQLQEQTTGSLDSSSAAAGNSSSAVSWWMQQLQQRVVATPAPAPAASSNSTTATVEQGSPADWFICDGPGLAAAAAGGSDGAAAAAADAAVPTRYFVIQGSISLNHWVINLSIDPVDFENGALGGVKVHRGVYEAALEMLDSFVPFVQEHLAKHPDGKVAFTGHSLGGSLATLLMLLLVHRGILPVANVATVRTFGAPAIFCEGATSSPPSAGFCQSCSLPCEHREERSAASAAAGAAAAAGTGRSGQLEGGLLGRLGLAPETVVNVIMCRDIVPRAFVCDYTLVADVLKSWLPSFKEHVGLAACREHKALYNFLGTVEVLQPSAECPFMLPDEAHSMLPQQPALYKLTEPCCNLPAANPATPVAAPASPCSCSGACSGSCSGCAAASSCSGSKAGKKKSNGKLGAFGSFGSFGSLANLGSTLSLTSAIADLTSTFTLISGNSGSIVSVPVEASEVATATATAGEAAAAAVEPMSAGAESLAAASDGQRLAAGEPDASAAEVAAAADPLGLTLGDAILTFMNSPHPLETLSEMRAYGPAGSISRFHNPNSYTQALKQLSGACK